MVYQTCNIDLKLYWFFQDEFQSQNSALVETYRKNLLEDLEVRNIIASIQVTRYTSDPRTSQDQEIKTCVQAQTSFHAKELGSLSEDSSIVTKTEPETRNVSACNDLAEVDQDVGDLIDLRDDTEKKEEDLRSENDLECDKLDCDKRKELNAR